MCLQTKRLLYKLKISRSLHQPIRRARCCLRRRNRTAPVLYGSRWSFAARWNLKTHWLCWQEEGQRVAGWVQRCWPHRWPSTGCCWKRKPKGSWRGKESQHELFNHLIIIKMYIDKNVLLSQLLLEIDHVLVTLGVICHLSLHKVI